MPTAMYIGRELQCPLHCTSGRNCKTRCAVCQAQLQRPLRCTSRGTAKPAVLHIRRNSFLLSSCESSLPFVCPLYANNPPKLHNPKLLHILPQRKKGCAAYCEERGSTPAGCPILGNPDFGTPPSLLKSFF
eukprot:jgi/Botrbrau1/21330/Bobra.0184s0040.1